VKTELFHLTAAIELRHWWFVGRRRVLGRLIRAVLAPSRDSLVVDIGCGTGANLGSLGEDYACLGIDPSAEAIALARRRFPHVTFIEGHAPADLGRSMMEARLFLVTDVLEHVPDDFLFLSRLLEAAGPGALFLITVPADMRLWSPHDEGHGHYRRYDARRLARVWEGLPVETMLLSYFNTRLYPLVRLARAAGRLRRRASGPAGLDLKMLPQPLNDLLGRVFAGEGQRLERAMRGTAQGYAFGSSLVALLRRGAGAIAPRHRPHDIAPDRYNPVAAEVRTP